MGLKALLLPKVLRFFFITLVRIVGIVALLLVTAAETQEIVRNAQGYAAALKETPNDIEAGPKPSNTTATSGNTTTTLEVSNGYVLGTTVPDHAGGIFFSTFFRFINVLVLFFLLLSEFSPPWKAVTRFYVRYFPPLGEESSVGFLGLAMMWISTSVLSQDVRNFATVSAWLLFVVGAINMLLGLFYGPTIRDHRAIFETEKVSVLPISSKSSKKSTKSAKDSVSYPAPVEIGFPTPAYGSKSAASLGLGGAFDTAPYIVHQRPVEMAERRTHTPTPSSSVNRSRSGKGIVTIRTSAEEADLERHSESKSSLPLYPHAAVV